MAWLLYNTSVYRSILRMNICAPPSKPKSQPGFWPLLLEHCFGHKPALYLTSGCLRHDISEEYLAKSAATGSDISGIAYSFRDLEIGESLGHPLAKLICADRLIILQYDSKPHILSVYFIV